MESEIHSDDVRLGAQLHTLISRLSRWSNRHAGARLALSQARLLSLIEAHQPTHISTLAWADNCSQPGMTLQVQRLERDKLINRQADPDDARAVLISITPHGYHLLDETRRARARVIAHAIAKLDEDSRAGLHESLRNLTHLLNTAADEYTPSQTSRD